MVNDDETDADADLLETLSGFAGLPLELEELAERAAMAGLLREPFNRAAAKTLQDEQPSLVPGGIISPTRPSRNFGQLANQSATFFAHLRQELLVVLGPPRIRF